jgi:glycosyltransferase involved in cell wall biosynthesis
MSNEQKKSRLRVPIVYHFFAHYRGPVNRELVNNGEHEYWFAGAPVDPRNIGIKEWEVEEDAPGRFIPTKCFYIAKRILFQSGMIKLAFDKRFDAIIYLGDPNYLATWISAPLAKLAGKRVLFWSHGWLRTPTGLNGWLRRQFFKIADGLLLYGHRAKEIAVTKEGFDPDNIYVVYNSLDYRKQVSVRDEVTLEELDEMRKELFPGSDAPIVTLVGRINRGRRGDQLIKAAEILKNRGQEMNLLLIGGMPDKGHREELEKLAADAGVRTNFYGPCYDESLLCRFIMCSTALCSPGKVGLLAMHSLTYGTPCVTHNNPEKHGPEYESVIDGVNGAMFEWDNLESLADKLSEWAAKPWLPIEDRKAIWQVIDDRWNPIVQQQIIDGAVSGIKPGDLPQQDPPEHRLPI